VRLVFVTQTLDADHPALAQTLDVVRELAARTEELVVLCATVGLHEPLPPHVRVRTFGSRTKLGRGLRFARLVVAELARRPRPEAVLAHMVPLFLVLAAPLAKPLRIRLLLWYTHWHASRMLRVATRLADAVLSVDLRSFPFESPKVRGIGHAIDVERFSPVAVERPEGPVRLVALGRLARWKGYETLLDGFARAIERGLDARLELRGPALTGDELAHREELRRLVEGSEVLRARVELAPPVPRRELPALLARADALVSATQPRGAETLDKVVYEAAACGVPVVASNQALAEFLGGLPLELRFPPRDADVLAARLLELGVAPVELRRQVGADLRRRVVESHSVASWAEAVISVARE
jgi:glycosyltransferase involved in cell wall biosynthesis